MQSTIQLEINRINNLLSCTENLLEKKNNIYKLKVEVLCYTYKTTKENLPPNMKNSDRINRHIDNLSKEISDYKTILLILNKIKEDLVISREEYYFLHTVEHVKYFMQANHNDIKVSTRRNSI